MQSLRSASSTRLSYFSFLRHIRPKGEWPAHLQALAGTASHAGIGFRSLVLLLPIFALLLPLISGAAESNAAPAARLVVNSEKLEPNSTFEIRFAEPMVSTEQIGKVANPSPVSIVPNLSGTFTWLSTRSGVFTPAEALPLSTTFRFSLSAHLKNAGGETPKGELQGIVETPPFELKAWAATQYFSPQDAATTPSFALLFNEDVEASGAERFISFSNADGQRIPARLTRVDPAHPKGYSFPAYRSKDHSLLTWKERFHENKSERAITISAGAPGPENILFATPVTPLGVGSNWVLVLADGLPGKAAGLTFLSRVEIPIGNIKPFKVEKVEAVNDGHGGRRLMVSFSKALSGGLDANNIKDWIRIKPAPAKLAGKIRHAQVEFSGNFALDTSYEVEVRKGLAALQPFIIAESYQEAVTFQPIPASVALEEFTTHQLSSGTRHFHMRVVNTPKLRISAKLLPTETLPTALIAYQKRYTGAEDFILHKLAVDTVAGKTIFSREITGSKQTDTEREIKIAWDEILGAGKTGVVLVTVEQESKAKGQRSGAQAIVQVTDLGVVWKSSATETFVHVFSLATGAPVPGAKLRFVAPTGAASEMTLVTDESGIATLPGMQKAEWLLVESGADFHLVSLENGEDRLSLYRFHVPHRDFDDEPADDGISGRQVFLFTERGVYKPGETVHLKGFVRDTRAGAAHLPAGAKVRIKANDDRGREIYSREVTLSEFASLDAAIPLPDGSLGTYNATVSFGAEGTPAEGAASYPFEVQNYTPNAFEIRINGPKQVVGAPPLELPIQAKYYMGKSLSQALLTWTLQADDQKFSPEGFEAFNFCDAIDDYRVNKVLDRASHFADQGNLQLTADGQATIATTVPLNTKAPQRRHVQLICEVTDLNEQTVTQSHEIQVDASDFYLGMGTLPEVVQKGDTLPVRLIAVRPDGTPNPDPVATKLRITRIDWQNNRVVTDDDATENESEPIFNVIEERKLLTEPVKKKEHRWQLAADPKETLIAGAPGLYLLEASAKDGSGRDVQTSMTFYVTGENVTEWNYRNEYQIELISDKLEYLSGETAHILVKTPITGQALVTVERDHVLRSFVTQLGGNASSVEIPLMSEDAPNVFVSVMMLRGAKDSSKKYREPDYRTGFCQLKVTRPEAKLTVYVHPERERYQPGESVTVNAEAHDLRGKPRANAEVTLYAVDEGVLSLTGYTTPDPLIFFAAPVPLSVTTSLTLPSLLKEDPEQKTFGNKGYMIGGGGDLGEAFRKNFVTCAFWNADLRTDEAGRVTATFNAPDSLTRYRLIAVVQTKDDAFGSGESAFEVSKPIMLDPALPRFANVGDKVVIRGVLHNLTDQDGQVDVQLTLDETASTEHPARLVTLPAHGSLAVDYPLAFLKAGTAKWKWVARFTGVDGKTAFRDAVESTLKVGYPVQETREVQLGRSDAARTDLIATANPAALEGEGSLTVSLGTSRILELRESLHQLLHYPYGCVEQTTSSTLPWLVMRDFQGLMPEMTKSEAEIRSAVNHGIDRLLTMQTTGGGLSYWPGGAAPHFWGSAYGGMAMALARKAGYEVPAEAFDSLCKYLAASLREPLPLENRWILADRCLAVYTLALAGRAEPAYHEALFKSRLVLADESRCLLALAIQESKGASEMVTDLLATHRAPQAEEDPFWSTSRETAIRLLAWTQFQADAPTVDNLATELFGSRREGHWLTTQGNCWSLMALGRYLKFSEKGLGDFAGSLSFAGQQEEFALNRANPLHRVTWAFGAAAPHDSLVLEKPAEKRIFSEVVISSHSQALTQPRQAQGFSIDRSYAKVEDDGSLSELKDPVVGDRVLITLHINVPRKARYVAVNDPLPSLFEAVNPVFKSQQTRGGEALGSLWTGDFHELRDDRALFFADFLYPGDYTIRYLARVRAAGTATAPSAKIEEMYHPERFGTTATVQLSSLQLK